MEYYLSSFFLLSLLQIIWIDLLLSGDNAVVIAMACRSLPPQQRKLGIVLGAGTAIVLRILLAIVVTELLGVPFLKIAGGLLLLWIAVKLVVGDDDNDSNIQASSSLWRAVRTIAIADIVMSLDNVVAIAAAARGHFELFIFGLLLSIPLIMLGSTLIVSLIQRFPLFVWAGAALLGWIAGEVIVSDPVVLQWLSANMAHLVEAAGHEHTGSAFAATSSLHYGSAVVGSVIVLIIGYLLTRHGGTPEQQIEE